MDCPACQAENPPNAKFCMNCAAPLLQRCAKCGTDLPAQARFCNQCAEPVAGSETTSTSIPQALQSLIPGEMAQKLAAARLQRTMVGERRIVTMLFCDVTGSTAAAGQLDPEDWAQIINGVFEKMIGPVYRYEGTVARLMGDAILAFFGAPVAHEDDPQRAILAGLDIVKGFQPYREQISIDWGVDIDVRVGINTGLVLVGEVGSDLQVEYTALGDAINLAARMEQTAHPGTVQISEDTYRLVAPLFEWEDLGLVEVKGKDEPIHTFRPLGEKRGRLRGLASHGIHSPLVGRQQELSALQDRLERLIGGAGSLIFLSGEAGLGKSRLIAEIREMLVSAQESTVTWLSGQSLSFQQNASYTPWRQILRQAVGAPESDSPAEVRRKLHLSRQRFPLPADNVPFLEALLAVEGEESLAAIQGYAGDALTQRMTAAAREFLGALAAKNPTVAVFDDLHWSDQASLDLLQNVAGLVLERPVLIIAAARPDRWAGSWQLREQFLEKLPAAALEISLGPLSDSDATTLLAQLLAIDRLPKELGSLILTKSEGNPFYVEEVLRMLIDQGRIDRENGHWAVKADLQSLDIPDTLHGVLTARIDRLSEAAKFVLQAAAVVGRRFHTAILSAVLPEGKGVLLPVALAELEDAQLLDHLDDPRPGLGTPYLFRHVLTQEAAYQTLLLIQRRTYHRRTAEAIEQRLIDRLEEFYPELAFHFHAGRSFAQALKYSIRAGEAAFRLSASSEAAAHYGMAVRIIRKTDLVPDDLQQLYVQRGRALELTQQFDQALENYGEMRTLAEERSDLAMKLAAVLAEAIIRITSTPVQDPERGAVMAKQALQLAQALQDRASQAKALWVMLLQYWPQGWREEWIAYGEESLRIARELDLREQIALTLGDLALGYGSMAQLDRSVVALEETIQLWRELGNLPMAANSMNVVAMSYLLLGDYRKGIAVAQESYAISKPIGNLWSQLSGALEAAVCYLEAARFGEAISWLQEAVELSERGELAFQESICRAFLGLAFAWIGATPLALDQAEKAAPGADRAPGDIQLWIRTLLVLIQIETNYVETASQLVEKYLTETNPRNLATPAHIYATMAKCLLLAARHDSPNALAELDAFIALLVETGVQHFRPDAHYTRAGILLALQRPQEAGESLSQARADAERLGTKRLLWRILALEAQVAMATGAIQTARQLQASAKSEIGEIAQLIYPGELRAAFLAQPQVCSLMEGPEIE